MKSGKRGPSPSVKRRTLFLRNSSLWRIDWSRNLFRIVAYLECNSIFDERSTRKKWNIYETTRIVRRKLNVPFSLGKRENLFEIYQTHLNVCTLHENRDDHAEENPYASRSNPFFFFFNKKNRDEKEGTRYKILAEPMGTEDPCFFVFRVTVANQTNFSPFSQRESERASYFCTFEALQNPSPRTNLLPFMKRASPRESTICFSYSLYEYEKEIENVG